MAPHPQHHQQQQHHHHQQPQQQQQQQQHAAVQYTMQLPSRLLVAVPGQRSRSQWLVGSTSMRDENEVRLLEFDPDREALVSAAVWVHPDEVWDAAACPLGTERLATVHSRAGAYGVTLWQAPQGGGSQLAALARLEHSGVVRRVLWSTQAPETVVTVEEGALRKWQVGAAGAQCVAAGSLSAPSAAAGGAPGAAAPPLWGAALHPRNPGLAASVAGRGLQVWDLQSARVAAEAPGAHQLTARDVDWAPGNEHRLVTAGDDARLRFWDTRLLGRGEPLLELPAHSHWAWACRYSPFHDQLLASCSTDATVALWYAPALARLRDAPGGAAPAVAAAAARGGGRGEPGDGRAALFDAAHDDSVYGLAWSAADPWLLASMSYDGRVALHHVPKGLKYKILI